MPDGPVIEPLRAGDAGELFTLQRAAYVGEARIYGDPELPPLLQTLDELVDEVATCTTLTLTTGRRMLAAVRARESSGVLHIGRLIVAPDQQGRGLGSSLLEAIEQTAGCGVRQASLFTGHRSAGNLQFYRRRGYVEIRREILTPTVTLVHLDKSLHQSTG